MAQRLHDRISVGDRAGCWSTVDEENPSKATERICTVGKAIAHQRIYWCNRSVDWTALAVEDGLSVGPVQNAVWSYELDGLTYFGFSFDPLESVTTTQVRALNWLNRHHMLPAYDFLHLNERSALSPVVD